MPLSACLAMPLSACHRHAPLADGVCATTLQIFTKFFKTPRFSANLARHQGHQDDSQMAPAQIRVVPLDDLLSGHENLEALLSANLRETLEEQLEQGGDLDEYMINKVRDAAADAADAAATKVMGEFESKIDSMLATLERNLINKMEGMSIANRGGGGGDDVDVQGSLGGLRGATKQPVGTKRKRNLAIVRLLPAARD